MTTDPSLTLAQPLPNQEFPIGVDFVVSGTAVGTWVQLPEELKPRPDPIRSVTVQVDNELPVVKAALARSGSPPLVADFSATIRLNSPGEHTLTVTAVGRFVGTSKTVAVATPGTTTTRCKFGVWWTNYTKSQPSFRPYRTCTPESLAGIVAIVREAEAANKRMHAF